MFTCTNDPLQKTNILVYLGLPSFFLFDKYLNNGNTFFPQKILKESQNHGWVEKK